MSHAWGMEPESIVFAEQLMHVLSKANDNDERGNYSPSNKHCHQHVHHDP